jgi:hypothetical protein
MSRRAKKPGLVKLARELGAADGKRIDWYVVAEYLARSARPDLVDGPAVSSNAKRDGFYLVLDVEEVRRRKRLRSIEKACYWLASGYLPYSQMVSLPDGSKKVRVRFASEDWTRRTGKHWRRRYYEFIQANPPDFSS